MAPGGEESAWHHDLAMVEQAFMAYRDGQVWQRTRELWGILHQEIAEEHHIQAQLRLYTCVLTLLDEG